ncbi:hypothetical protein DFH27DRAFT_526181 [Peziza echinospora]|nr:hypothetical protein DFH27DRAFT_526181 [Peziza echinospora]
MEGEMSVEDFLALNEPQLSPPTRRTSSPPFSPRSPGSSPRITTSISTAHTVDLYTLCAQNGITLSYDVQPVENGQGFYAELTLSGRYNTHFTQDGPYASKKLAKEAVSGVALGRVREQVAGWGRGGGKKGGGQKGGVLGGLASGSGSGGIGGSIGTNGTAVGRGAVGGGARGGGAGGGGGGGAGAFDRHGSGDISSGSGGSSPNTGNNSSRTTPPSPPSVLAATRFTFASTDELKGEDWVSLLNLYTQKARLPSPQYTDFGTNTQGPSAFACEVRIPGLTGQPVPGNPNPQSFGSINENFYPTKKLAKTAAAREAVLWIRRAEPGAATTLFNPANSILSEARGNSGGIIEIPQSIRDADAPQIANYLFPLLGFSTIVPNFETLHGVPGLFDVSATLTRKKPPLGIEQTVEIGPIRNIYGKKTGREQISGLAVFFMLTEAERLGVQIVGLPGKYYKGSVGGRVVEGGSAKAGIGGSTSGGGNGGGQRGASEANTAHQAQRQNSNSPPPHHYHHHQNQHQQQQQQQQIQPQRQPVKHLDYGLEFDSDEVSDSDDQSVDIINRNLHGHTAYGSNFNSSSSSSNSKNTNNTPRFATHNGLRGGDASHDDIYSPRGGARAAFASANENDDLA